MGTICEGMLTGLATSVPASPQTFRKQTIGAYIELGRWHQLWGLPLVSAGGAVIAQDALPPAATFLGLTVGGLLLMGAASALNQYLDRDVDRLMLRTRRRPLPSGRVAPKGALRFGVGLTVSGTAALVLSAGSTSALIGLAGLVLHVLVYTCWLKRSLFGNVLSRASLPGVPVLVGWAANVPSDLARVEPWLLVTLLALLSPSQTWTLALRNRADYERASLHLLSLRLVPAVACEVVLLSILACMRPGARYRCVDRTSMPGGSF